MKPKPKPSVGWIITIKSSVGVHGKKLTKKKAVESARKFFQDNFDRLAIIKKEE